MSEGREVFALKGRRVWVAGHRGMVGSALVRRLAGEGCAVRTVGREACGPRRQEAVFLAAARVGGILANDRYPADFLYDNLMIAAKVAGVPELVIWGTGRPRREFLHVDDLADACVHLMKVYAGEEPVNVGCGEDVSVAGLAALVARVVGFEGEPRYDTGRPDGTPRKLLDVSRLTALGWRPRIPLEEGLRATYAWYRVHGPACG